MANSFSAKDLALLLPDTPADIKDLRHTKFDEDEKEGTFKPRLDKSKKVTRYFPGKLHDDALEGGEDAAGGYFEQARPSSQPMEDRRLARLAAASKADEGDSQSHRPAASSGRRRIFEAEVIVDEKEDAEDDESIDELDDYFKGKDIQNESEDAIREQDEEEDHLVRRAKIQQRIALRTDDELVDSVKQIEVSRDATLYRAKKEESESESEYETDTDEYTDEEEERLKPVFVPKHKRETIREAEMKEEENKLNEKRKEIRLEERKAQTRALVADTLHRKEREAELAATDNDSDAGLPDDTDDLDDELEFEAWKVRELARLKRDAEERELAALEKADLLRRRNMTDEERLEEDRKLGVGAFAEKEKKQWKFMQKYYHKGAFYMDEASRGDTQDVRNRDYNEPTLEDRFDKESLPKVMQVKKFGMRGRTKYTHLADQDTTNKQAPLIPKHFLQQQDSYSKYMNKRGGVGDIDNAGRLKRPKND
jgi:microfibrillar-associated protein 1